MARQSLAGRKRGDIPYIGIANWMERMDLTYGEIGELLDMDKSNISKVFRGETDTFKYMIDKILDLTGMTYEEAFKTSEEKDA